MLKGGEVMKNDIGSVMLLRVTESADVVVGRLWCGDRRYASAASVSPLFRP